MQYFYVIKAITKNLLTKFEKKNFYNGVEKKELHFYNIIIYQVFISLEMIV